jgi:putative lipoprotein
MKVRMMLLALLALAANPEETKVVTGTATYRERVALPPGAVLEAALEDVSRPGAPADVIGRTRVEKPGQPPFRFSIPYEPARIVEGRSYSVRARVTVGGNLMFTTDQSYPVLTRGHGSNVE